MLDLFWVQRRRSDGECGNEQDLAEDFGEEKTFYEYSQVRFSLKIACFSFLENTKKEVTTRIKMSRRIYTGENSPPAIQMRR